MYNQSFNELNQLVGYSKDYFRRGWMYATTGNLSVKEERSNEIIITASDMNKGKLSASDFLIVNINSGKPSVPSKNLPSSETSIHLAIYNSFPESRAIIHVHDPEAVVAEYFLSEQKSYCQVDIPPLEILKNLTNYSLEQSASFFVLHNFDKMERIADLLAGIHKQIQFPFFLIENHGITVWGQDVEDANKNLEAAHHLLEILNRRKLK